MIEERRRRRQEILAKHRSQQDLSAMAAAPTATAQQQQAAAEAAAAGGSAQQEAQAAAQPAAAAAEAAAQPSQRARPVSANGEGAAAAAGDEGEPEELSDNEEAVVAQLGTTHAGALDIFRHDGSGAGACGGGPESAAPSEMPPQSGGCVGGWLLDRLQGGLAAGRAAAVVLECCWLLRWLHCMAA